MKNKLMQRLFALFLLLCLLTGCAVTGSKPTTASTTNPATEAPAATVPEETQPEESITLPLVTEPEESLPPQQEDDRPRPEPPEQEEQSTQPEQESQPTQPEETAPPAIPNSSGFKVYFIDVGQADAALVICDGQAMLIDGGNSDDSNLIYSFLKKKGVSHLDYIIATHAHEDHVGGLSGALNYATVDTVYCPTKSYSSNAFNNFAKNVQKQGKSITVPNRDTKFSLGSASCTVLAVNTESDANNTSIVLRIVYGSTSFLFTGDAEREVEQAMINRGVPLKSTVLKVGHHGSYTSSSYQFIWNVMPSYAVISCGKGNSYGHPHDEVLSRLRDADVYLFRTDLQGDITCTSNGSSVSFSVSRNWNANVFGDVGSNSTQPSEPEITEPLETEPSATEAPSGGDAQDYVLNTNSMKFHYAFCEWAQKISSKNRKDYTGSREDLLEQGYSPCGSCIP